MPHDTLPFLSYRLTTAEITYHMPDHPGLLQTFLWQQYDMAPEFPKLQGFLEFWRREIDAVMHSVAVAGAPLPGHDGVRFADLCWSVH
jgi:uncharacterized protein Usg